MTIFKTTLVLLAASALAQDPWREWQSKGEDAFRAGRIADSVRAFDRAIELEPRLAPQNWQRGISLYYAGRFDDCRKQFELHRTVNPEDVENAAFHYICTARSKGVDAARKGLIPTQTDGRPGMLRIQDLYAGKTTVDRVVAAAPEGEARFYAHLYCGLWAEAGGQQALAREHIAKAAAMAPSHYMGDVARVHAKLRGW